MGYKTPAFGITRITTARGELVYEADPDAAARARAQRADRRLHEPDDARRGRRAAPAGAPQIEGVPAVGKTGTTSSYRDAWFCGFTGNYVAAVWFGNDDYRQTKNLTGGTLPDRRLAEVHGLCAHQHRDQAGARASTSSRRRSSSPKPRTATAATQAGAAADAQARGRASSCSISPTRSRRRCATVGPARAGAALAVTAAPAGSL